MTGFTSARVPVTSADRSGGPKAFTLCPVGLGSPMIKVVSARPGTRCATGMVADGYPVSSVPHTVEQNPVCLARPHCLGWRDTSRC